jgi:hypothetical protein
MGLPLKPVYWVFKIFITFVQIVHEAAASIIITGYQQCPTGPHPHPLLRRAASQRARCSDGEFVNKPYERDARIEGE